MYNINENVDHLQGEVQFLTGGIVREPKKFG